MSAVCMLRSCTNSSETSSIPSVTILEKTWLGFSFTFCIKTLLNNLIPSLIAFGAQFGPLAASLVTMLVIPSEYSLKPFLSMSFVVLWVILENATSPKEVLIIYEKPPTAASIPTAVVVELNPFSLNVSYIGATWVAVIYILDAVWAVLLYEAADFARSSIYLVVNSALTVPALTALAKDVPYVAK